MWFAIRAYEGMYEGLHGIESFDIIEADNEDIAYYEYGLEMSGDLIDEYGTVDPYEFDERDEQEYENAFEDNLRADVFPITELSNEYVREHLEALTSELEDDYRDFVGKYCNRRG